MKQFITIDEFVEQLVKETKDFKDMRILSIGCTSDGKYSFRCKDEHEHERRFEVSCWEGRK